MRQHLVYLAKAIKIFAKSYSADGILSLSLSKIREKIVLHLTHLLLYNFFFGCCWLNYFFFLFLKKKNCKRQEHVLLMHRMRKMGKFFLYTSNAKRLGKAQLNAFGTTHICVCMHLPECLCRCSLIFFCFIQIYLHFQCRIIKKC